MIAWLSGIIKDKNPPHVVIDVNGVGYEINTSMTTFFSLPEIGQAVQVHIQAIFREDSEALYGFLELKERSLFRQLIRINGIGPKTALGILSSTSPVEFSAQVINKDISRLAKLPGIGKKTAERLVIELSDKLDCWSNDNHELSDGRSTTKKEIVSEGHRQDAIEALISLGYSANNATKLIDKVKSPLSGVEDLIREALRKV